MQEQVNHSRRNFLKAAGSGIVLIVPRILLPTGAITAAMAASGCGGGGSGGSEPAPAPQLPLTVLEQRINGTTVGSETNVPLATNVRYNTSLMFTPTQDVQNVAIDGRLYGMNNHLEGRLQTGIMSLAQGSVVNIPNSFPFVLRQSNENGRWEYHLVTNPGTPQEARQAITGLYVVPTGTQGSFGSLRKVQECVDFTDYQFQASDKAPANADPALAVVTGDAADSIIDPAAFNLQTQWRNRVAAYVQNPVVGLVTQSQANGKKSRVLIGTPATNADLAAIVTALGIPTADPVIASYERQGDSGLVVTGPNADGVALASEALYNPAQYAMTQSNKYKVSGTSGNLTVTAL